MSDGSMTGAWREALACIDTLLAQRQSERDRTLEEMAQSRPDLHARVQALLTADRKANDVGFLDIPAANDVQAFELRAGVTVGPYKIVRELGKGGMGEVWLATRADGLYRGEVAIKTLHPYFAGGAMRERFLREAQLLGRLAHPHIARLLDAGVSDGTVYIVLEYVRGQQIDAWCDARALDVAARLKLFLDVCAAVAHAHANLIVHRDIKPSNILITDDGQAKLLDFGIGKLVEDESIERAELTLITGRIFTPEFAAPEQVTGESITTATDVYSLGVLLYLLLCGERPYGRDLTGRQLEHAVVHGEPGKLSRIIKSLSDDAARHRASTKARLSRELAGDLDVIVARALAKKPQDRYPSVYALAEDVERHLANKPIRAREEGLGYRVAKFVRRHAWGVGAAAAAAVATIVGIAAVIWQTHIAGIEERKATAIKDFLIGVFERNNVAHPDGARARATTAEQLLALSARQIQSDLKEVPQVRAELLNVMSGIYSSLDMQREALELRQSQLQLLGDLHGESSLEVAKVLPALAHSQHQIGDYDAARRSADAAVSRLRGRGDDSLELAKSLHLLSNLDQRSGRNDDAMMRRLDDALRIVTEHHPRNPERIEILMSLARGATLRSDAQASLRYGEQALNLIERNESDVNAFDRAAVYQVMSVRLRGVNRYDDALRMIGRATEEFERSGGADHPFTIDSRREHGNLLNLLGRRAEGVRLIAQSVADLERTKGIDDPELTTNARIVLGQVQVVHGDFAAAEPNLSRALRVSEESGNPVLATVARVMLARMHSAQGRFAESERDLAGIEAASIQISGERSLRHAIALTRLGQFELARGRLAAAESHFAKLFAWPEPPGAMSSGRANAGVGLVRIALERGQIDSAVSLAKTVLVGIEASRERPIMKDPEADIRMLLGAALFRSGDATAAKPHLEWAVGTREQMDIENSPWLAEARLYFAQALQALGDTKAARDQLTRAEQALRLHSSLAPPFRNLLRQTQALTKK